MQPRNPFAIDPNHNHTPDDPRVFVFGSNYYGLHGGGAARYAADKLGAEMGVWEGMTGRSYALPTCSEPGVSLPIEDVRGHVNKFIDYAYDHPDVKFFVSAVGCGLAGLQEWEVAPMFLDAPENCILPPGWKELGQLVDDEGPPDNVHGMFDLTDA